MTGYRRGARVGVVDDGGVVYLAALPDGPIAVLDEMAALIWRYALTEVDVVTAVAAACAARPEDVRADVGAFVTSLVTRGLLMPGPAPA